MHACTKGREPIGPGPGEPSVPCILRLCDVSDTRVMLLTRTNRSGAWRALWQQRQKLPIHKEAGALIEAVAANPVVVLVGETGCGKSTQVPQLILDARIEAGAGGSCSIICTQPRRVAAMGLAERVAQERCEHPGQPAALTAHQVRTASAHMHTHMHTGAHAQLHAVAARHRCAWHRREAGVACGANLTWTRLLVLNPKPYTLSPFPAARA